MKKFSVMLDQGLVAKARRRAGPRGLSALLNEALRGHLQRKPADRPRKAKGRHPLDELIEEYEREHGPISAERLEKADEPWRELDRRRALRGE